MARCERAGGEGRGERALPSLRLAGSRCNNCGPTDRPVLYLAITILMLIPFICAVREYAGLISIANRPAARGLTTLFDHSGWRLAILGIIRRGSHPVGRCHIDVARDRLQIKRALLSLCFRHVSSLPWPPSHLRLLEATWQFPPYSKQVGQLGNSYRAPWH